jgi:hypothetical protein
VLRGGGFKKVAGVTEVSNGTADSFRMRITELASRALMKDALETPTANCLT